MKRYHIVFSIFITAILSIFMTSCQNEEYVDVDFSSQLEQPSVENQEKAYLSNENYIYWEPTDFVRVYPEPLPIDYMDCQLTPDDDPRHATFKARHICKSDTYYGVYPADFGFDDTWLKIRIPESHAYRDDYSFGSKSWPMVAYHGGSEGEPKLDFHSVCGMARIQMTATTAATIESITFTESGASHTANGFSTRPISGDFNVVNINKNAPHITPIGSTSGTSITLTEINKPIGPSQLCTFYLPLPATTAYNAGTTTTSYAITMQVKSNKGTFTQDFAVKIRRNSITPVRAININAWNSSNASFGISGCGTEERPFLILNLEDMKRVKTAFEQATPKINGQTITADTYFAIGSSDLTLDNTWTVGINNFKGHMIYKGGNVVYQGIANNSQAPLFKSISSEGVVEDLTIRGSINYIGTADFSPLCGVNNGLIDRCRNYCRVSATIASVAGICVTNGTTGRIHNAANTQAISTSANNKYAGGICITNNGVIDGYGTSIGMVTGREAGTICHTNNGQVLNCQISLNRIGLTNKFGGLVYRNASTGVIRYSEVLGVIVSTAELGGICWQNEGLIDQCKIGTDMLQGSGVVGGIAAYQRNSAEAEIRNCYNITVNTANIEATTGRVGGIVGHVYTGKVFNCYCDMEVASEDVTYYGAIIGEITGGSVENCYNGSRQARFCGLSNRMANLQSNCFDITDDLRNTCIYNTDNGKATRLSAGSDSYGSVGDYMITFLNAWVAAHPGTNADGTPKYLSWTADSPASNVAPELVSSNQ